MNRHKHEYWEILWQGDRYLRRGDIAEWYFWKDLGWHLMDFESSLQMEKALQSVGHRLEPKCVLL